VGDVTGFAAADDGGGFNKDWTQARNASGEAFAEAGTSFNFNEANDDNDEWSMLSGAARLCDTRHETVMNKIPENRIAKLVVVV